MKAARYARVSTDKQTHNTSMPNQLDRTAAYIEAQDWKLAGTFTEPGKSGENLDRPALIAARQAARRGEYDILVVHTLDRLTRDIDDLFLLRREFKAAGIKAWAVYDRVELTSADPDTLLQIVMKGYISHRERLDIRRRMRDGIDRTVAAGKWAGGRTPYGYRRDPKSGRLVTCEPEARIVEMIFGWVCDERMSTYGAKERLDALGILTPQAARRQPGKRCNDGTQAVPSRWTSGTVQFILHNETYTGRWTFGKTGEREPVTIDCPAIIDRTTFEKAQAALVRNRRYTQRPRYRYLLRGLVRCTCGAAFCGQTPRRGEKVYPHTYKCLARTDYRKKKRPGPCRSATVPGPELEAAVWAAIVEFIRQPHLLVAELAQQRTHTDDAASEIARTDQSMAAKRQELDRYLRLYGRGSIPVGQVENLAREAQSHIAALETYRRQLVERQRQADLWEQEMASLVEALEELQELLQVIDLLDRGNDEERRTAWEKKRAFVELMVKGVIIETCTEEDGERRPVAHITYSFERPRVDIPIPVEMVPLFDRVTALTSTLNGAIIAQSPTTE